MRIGIISLGGKSSKLLAKSCKDHFEQVDELDLRNFEIHLVNDDIHVNYEGKQLEDYDCLCIRGSYKYALLQRAITKKFHNKVHMPLKSESFGLAHNKFSSLLEMQKEGVAIPKTYYAANTKMATNILEKVDYPVIMKVQEGTHGKGVMIAESLQSAKTILDMLEGFKEPFIIQEFVQQKTVSDIRAIVVGNRVVVSYKRVAAKDEIRANTHAGGTRETHKITPEEEKLAIRAAKSIGAEIAGVDLFHSPKPSIIEINLSPSLYSLGEITKIDVVGEIAKYLFNETTKFKERKEAKIKKKLNKNGKDDGKKDKIAPKQIVRQAKKLLNTLTYTPRSSQKKAASPLFF